MRSQLTKYFPFSASFALAGKVYGHNYVLGITLPALSLPEEAAFEARVRQALIGKLESRDLGLHVDFLKGVEPTDANLLEVFNRILKQALAPLTVNELSLERDKRTITRLRPE